jgi:hypothetical protein
MSRVYSEANSVLAWLGDDTPYIKSVSDEWSILNEELPVLLPLQFPDQSLLLRAWETIADLVHRPYWARCWIVQEVLLAKQLVFLCGTKGRLSASTLLNWHDSISTYDDEIINAEGLASTKDGVNAITTNLLQSQAIFDRLRTAQGPVGQSETYSCVILPWRVSESRDYSLKSLVKSFIFNECTDPWDKIYAFIGLAKHNPGITVDYTRSLDALFWDLISLDVTDSTLAVQLAIAFGFSEADLRFYGFLQTLGGEVPQQCTVS